MNGNSSANIVTKNTLPRSLWSTTWLITVIPDNLRQKSYLPTQHIYLLLPGPDGSLVHPCNCCLKFFKTAQERDVHKEAEHKEKLSCKMCDRSFGNLRSLQGHNRARHRGPDCNLLHRCDCCFEYFKTVQERDVHREVDHRDELTCKKCNRNFVNLRSLEIHNRALHKGNLSEVPCTKCGEFSEC